MGDGNGKKFVEDLIKENVENRITHLKEGPRHLSGAGDDLLETQDFVTFAAQVAAQVQFQLEMSNYEGTANLAGLTNLIKAAMEAERVKIEYKKLDLMEKKLKLEMEGSNATNLMDSWLKKD